MKPWHPTLYTYWYAAARSDQLRRRPVAVTVLDQPIVLARLRDGQLLALEDRCPHRQAPLSAGCRTSTGIACPYHGWTFGSDGALQTIPGMPPGLPLPGVRARSFPVKEHDGLIWLRPADTGAAEPGELVMTSQPARRRFLWQTRWQAHVVDAMENFLDPMHTHAIHPGLVRRDGERKRTTVRFNGTAEGFCVDYSSQDRQSGLLFRLFESPRTRERAHFSAPGSAQIEYGYANGSTVRITLHFTPRTAGDTEVFATLHVEGRWAPAWAVRLLVWPFLRRVGEQDRRILQLQSENMKRFPEQRGASTRLDVVRTSLEQFWSGNGLPQADESHEIEMML
ncbi:MAG TPA: aromatic ring-hydroxylating dioxygenase subunit alpha [Pseudoxanthomonas sp.]